jgi:hypothetical protein
MKIGEVLQSKNGGYYIKFSGKGKAADSLPLTINDGDVLFLKKPSERLDGMVERGIITEAQAEESKAKTPSFVKFDIELGRKV